MLRHSVHNVAGSLVRLVCWVVTIPLLLGFLGADQYARWAWVQAVLGFFAVAEAALATTGTVFLARAARPDHDRDDAGATFNAAVAGVSIVATVCALALWLAAPAVAELAGALSRPDDPLAPALRWAAVVVFARLAQPLFLSLQQAHGRFGVLNLVTTGQVVASSLAQLLVARGGGSLAALMAWQAAVAIAGLTVHALAASPVIRPSRAWAAARLGEMARHASMALFVTSGTVVFMHGDRLVLAHVLPAAELGVYATLTSMAAQINSLSAAAAQPLLPLLSKLPHAERSSDTARASIRMATRMNAALAVALSFGLALAGPVALALVVPSWRRVGDDASLRMVAFIYSAYSLNAVAYFILQAVGRLRITGIIVLGSAAVSTSLAAAGGSWLGLRGAIAGNLGYALTFTMHFLAMKELGIEAREWTRWGRWPVVALAAALVVSLVVGLR